MPEVNSDCGSICAVIVTYNPDIGRFASMLNSLQHQTETIVVVDNSSSADLHGLPKEDMDKVEVISLPHNQGIATAQNKGIGRAIQKGCEYILLMDQDSVPGKEMVRTLYDAHIALAESGINVSAVGPVFINPINESQHSFFRTGLLGFKKLYCNDQNYQYIRVDHLISSGALIKTDAIEKVGVMDDRLFIDHVDNEWFLRAKSLGYDAYGICTAIMEHTLGEDSKTFWLFGERRMILHKPFRYYYMFRNSILLYRRSYIPLKWKYTDFISRIRVLIILLLITNKRIECVKYITQGVIDGLRGKAGAI